MDGQAGGLRPTPCQVLDLGVIRLDATAPPRLVANTVALDGPIPGEEVLELIDHSYALACGIEGADC